MTWAYSGNPASSTKDAIRFLVGDTLSGDPQLQDEEVNYAYTLRGTIWSAAALCCRAIAAQFSRRADTSQGELRTSYSVTSRSYMMRAKEYEERDVISGGAKAWAGGISISDKISREGDADRKQPEFNIGMDDNAIPVSPGGNQRESSEDNVS